MNKEEYYGVTEFEDQLDMFDELDYSAYDVDVSYEFAMDLEYPEITLEEFEQNVAPQHLSFTTQVDPGIYTRDWVLWEETKPLSEFSEVDALKKQVADLTESLYKAYGRIKELSDELSDMKSQLSQINIHKNTRTY